MHFLVNALSVTNQSGRHVLHGHLARVVAWAAAEHRFTFLYHAANADIVRDWGPSVTWVQCPSRTRDWAWRTLWEQTVLPRLCGERGVGCMFTPAGVATPRLRCRQIVFCQNPWCLVPVTQRSLPQKLKGWLQRQAYRYAMARADVMVFNSQYMHDAYRRNAGREAKQALVVYQGVTDATYAAAARIGKGASRDPMAIVSVSAMAPHKGVETVLQALALLHRKHNLPAVLHLVGSWPDARYRRAMECAARGLGIEGAVFFRGHVSQEDLHRSYARARAFCLMSHCESFGIPAIEAQCFGTPVVSSNCCAVPEVCGDGALYALPADAPQAADQLARLLDDGGLWRTLSERAVANASRFRWDEVSRPLFDVFSRPQPSPGSQA